MAGLLQPFVRLFRNNPQLAQQWQNPGQIDQSAALAALVQTPRPTAMPTPDPYAAAVAQAKQQYPRIANFPFKLIKGKGEGSSETYFPGDEDNPVPGNYTVQLRDPSVLNDPKRWANYIGLESIHALQDQDPRYQQMTQQFVMSMTPDQQEQSRRTFLRDRQMFGGGKATGQFADTNEAYRKWLHDVQAQEYIRGGIFTDEIPNWIGPHGEGQYTPAQLKQLAQIKHYLMTNA